MKKLILRLMLVAALFSALPATVLAAPVLIPVGRVVGLELEDGTVTVVDFEQDSAARAAGIEAGDRLLSIDGRQVTDTGDVRSILGRSQGSVQVTVRRGDEICTLRVEPAITRDGPKLGVFLRQGVTGIGTVTYWDPETGTFATLGHGVNDRDGQLLKLRRGSIYGAKVASVRRGKAGEPGQLMGALTQRDPLGTVSVITPQGVFGKGQLPWGGEPLPVCSADEVRTGEAVILSTVQGDTPREYSVEILKLYPASRHTGRNMLLRVTDPTLLETTGGIVQGMGVSYNKDNQWNP